jgi:hypothetical protein
VTSWLWPSAILIPIGGPSALVRALILVEKPRERSSALRADTAGAVMRADDGRIDHLQNRVAHSASNEDAASPHRKFQSPNPSGRSRHAAPVCNNENTASEHATMVTRRSAAATDQERFDAHSSSVISPRFKAALHNGAHRGQSPWRTPACGPASTAQTTTALGVQVSLALGWTLGTRPACAATRSGPSLDRAYTERLWLLPICVLGEDADGSPSPWSVKEPDER